MTPDYQFERSISLFILSISLLLTSCQSKQSPNQAKKDAPEALGQKIDKVLEEKMEAAHIPGVAVVIVKDGKIIYKQGYGVANVENQQKVHPDSTIFRLGSTSKALTFFTLTKLIEKGLLDYEDPVSKYIQGIQNPYQLKDTIRIKHLLTHTSGFDQIGYGRQILDFDLSLEARKAKRPRLLDFLQDGNLRRIRPAGQHFTYDTYGTSVAGAIIEMVTGLSYKEAMRKELFRPLGMESTNVETESKDLGRLAKGHGYIQDRYETMPYEIYLTPPASSIDATALDMGRLLQALTNQGSNAYGQLFSPETLQKVISPQFRPHPEFVGMSHGLWESTRIGSIPDAYNIRTIGHGGDMLGITCAMDYIPDLNIGFFVAANRNGEAGGGGVSIGRPVMQALLEHFGVEKKTPLYPVPKPNNAVEVEEYAGNYVFSIYCHTCTEEELKKGAWSRGNLIPIKAIGNQLLLDEQAYLAREKDIFVREDGKEMIFFGRNKKGKIAFFVFSDDSHSFERVE